MEFGVERNKRRIPFLTSDINSLGIFGMYVCMWMKLQSSNGVDDDPWQGTDDMFTITTTYENYDMKDLVT